MTERLLNNIKLFLWVNLKNPQDIEAEVMDKELIGEHLLIVRVMAIREALRAPGT
ncbi:MAG TPA: hypothetical protein VJ028_02725 [Patescibacteria group bacterium]|nr:hypothetical protein [Patescibacteria group bacterium]